MQLFEFLECFGRSGGSLFGTDRCKKMCFGKRVQNGPKTVTRRKRPGILWVLKTREQTAPDLRRSEKARGVDRTRFSCLKARWRIYILYIYPLPSPKPNQAQPLALSKVIYLCLISATVPSGTRSVSEAPLLISQIFSDLELSVLLF